MKKNIKHLADLISLAIVAICSSREICETMVYSELERLELNLNHEELTELANHIMAIRSGFQAAK
jgi:hypothetical protein